MNLNPYFKSVLDQDHELPLSFAAWTIPSST